MCILTYNVSIKLNKLTHDLLKEESDDYHIEKHISTKYKQCEHKEKNTSMNLILILKKKMIYLRYSKTIIVSKNGHKYFISQIFLS